MKNSFWCVWLTRENQKHIAELDSSSMVVLLNAKSEAWLSIFLLVGGVGSLVTMASFFIVGDFSWILAMLAILLIGVVTFLVGGYDEVVALPLFFLALLLGGGISISISSLLLSGFSPGRVSVVQWELFLFCSFAVAVFPLFAWMRASACDQLRRAKTLPDGSHPGLFGMAGCQLLIYLVFYPGMLLLCAAPFIEGFHLNPFYTWLHTQYDPVSSLAVLSGLCAAYAVSMGGSIASLVWQIVRL